MKRTFSAIANHRTSLLLAVMLLAVVGPGCVSWSPIFRGSIALTHWLGLTP